MAMNRVHRSILLSAVERYGSLFFFLVSTAILSRLLSPHEFGIYAVVNALIFVLAAIWAPLMEETMFRGALFNHLRGRQGWLVSSLIVGVLFALVHPQGWTAIPVLGSIGAVLASVREWRGSLIGPMTAHALNNATAITVVLLLVR